MNQNNFTLWRKKTLNLDSIQPRISLEIEIHFSGVFGELNVIYNYYCSFAVVQRSVNNGEGQWLECVMTSLGKVGSIHFQAPLTITERYWWAPHVALRDAHAEPSEQALRSHVLVCTVCGTLSFCHKGKRAGDHLQSTSQLFLHPTWNEPYRVSMLQSVDRITGKVKD